MTLTLLVATIWIGLALALFAAGLAMSRRPRRERRYLRERTWLRILAWTSALSAATITGVLVAGDQDLAADVAGVGIVAILLAFEGWSLAKAFPGGHDDNGG